MRGVGGVKKAGECGWDAVWVLVLGEASEGGVEVGGGQVWRKGMQSGCWVAWELTRLHGHVVSMAVLYSEVEASTSLLPAVAAKLLQ